ncbi:2-oxoacid:acceptor oxidoreductase family protein [Natranaerobius thermophilus]|uniref:2-oxoglutarate synthase n=1 Tax=Natranaerobius thermophilus (strain ATCC BAA-1301 / DSM 18059 / JW/NM-WN-LF) TaxID=457570 RepID=B2A3W5_NATTJ|nr:2-oxoacid:acceptor oxidoreductase family protein [Natranaerobius thermophilus]ACB85067.1 2-oxoglutarate synthase [Natranaerobius thermophilus JW/NM-WN-LF]
MSRWELRLSGSGGQGLILSGIILASAATKQGKNVIQTQSYGPEARGGASKAEVVISDDEIDYPEVTSPNFLLTLTEEAFYKYKEDISSDCKVLVDSQLNVDDSDLSNLDLYTLPFLETAEKELKRKIVANMVALGATVYFTQVVSHDHMKEAISNYVPQGTEELNWEAFQKGYQLAKEKDN